MSTTTRSGEAKAEALASTCRERSNTNLAVFPSCESRAPTATGGPASPANPRGSGPAISVKTARAASRPIRAIPLPLSAASSPIVPMPRQRNHSRFDWVERRSTGREGPRKQKRAGETLYDGLTGRRAVLAPVKGVALGLTRNHRREKNLLMRTEAPIYGMLRIRTEFAQQARSLVGR